MSSAPHSPSGGAAEPDPWGLSGPVPAASTNALNAPNARVEEKKPSADLDRTRSYPPLPQHPPRALAETAGATLVLPGLLPDAATPDPQGVPYAELTYLGQTRGSYLVGEGPLGLYVIDQHAASERVLHDRLLRRSFLASTEREAPNPLLFPRVVEIAEPFAQALELPENQAALAGIGFDLRLAGTRQVVIHGTPPSLPRADPERLLSALIEALRAPGHVSRGFVESLRLAFGAMACQAAVLPDEPVTPGDAIALFRELAAVDFAPPCPHGRPLVTTVRFDELDRRTRGAGGSGPAPTGGARR